MVQINAQIENVSAYYLCERDIGYTASFSTKKEKADLNILFSVPAVSTVSIQTRKNFLRF